MLWPKVWSAFRKASTSSGSMSLPWGDWQNPVSTGRPSVPAEAAPTGVGLPCQGRACRPWSLSLSSCPSSTDPCFPQWSIRVEEYLFWKREMAATPKAELWVARCAPKENVPGR